MRSGTPSPRTCRARRPAGGAGAGSGRCAGSWKRSCTWTGPGAQAVPARGLAALADGIRVLRRLARRRHPGPAARQAGRPGPGRRRAEHRADRGGNRLPAGPRRRYRAEGHPRLGQCQEGHVRKRNIAVDTIGPLLAVVITAASVQDRDAARPLLWNLHRACRRIRLIWADAVYAGKPSAWAAAWKMRIQIVARRNPHAFEVLPRRWVVERTFAWICKHCRTVRDYERLTASHEAMILWDMIRPDGPPLDPAHPFTEPSLRAAATPRWSAPVSPADLYARPARYARRSLPSSCRRCFGAGRSEASRRKSPRR
jgi:transposase